MSEAGGKRGFKAYLGTLVATVLFPVLWMKALRLARHHADADPRARAKVLAAITASVVIGAAGFLVISGFLASATAGMYDSMDARLAIASGEADYQEQVGVIKVAEGAIPTIQQNLANTTDATKRAALEATLQTMQEDLAEATARRSELEDNHLHYFRIQNATADQDDGEVRELMQAVPQFADAPGAKAKYGDLEANTDAAFAKKDQSVQDMTLFAWLFLWPSLMGAFLAPLAFAFGSILKAAFVESDTVGFKPYPGAAAGLFLLFGAFGVPAVFFAAWVFNDAFGRSEEGQIAL